MKKETKNIQYNDSDELVVKIFLSISVNFILCVCVSFLLYEIKFCAGTKLMFLYAVIIASYITAIILHTIIFIKKPIKKSRWVYFLITAIGLIPYTWYILIGFIL